MSGKVLTALERLEGAVIEIELQPEAAAEAAAEAQRQLREVAGLCVAEGLADLEPPCSWIASLLEIMTTHKAQASQEMVDLLLGPIDLMRRLIYLAQSGGEAGPPASPALLPATTAEAPAPAAVAPAATAAAQLPAARSGPTAIKVETEKLDGLLDILGELVITFALSSRHSAISEDQNRDLQENVQALGGLLERLEKQVAVIRMLQLNNLFMRMQRLVRDVAGKVGKKVELILRGGDVELDKGLIEELNAPLVHLLRNAVDHGVEAPDERQAAGKPAQARLRLEAERRDQYLVITVADDGRGLDRERILQKAREKGLLAPGRTYSDQDVYALITEPGFSTAKEVTDISGRGVGLDVVARAVAMMGAELIIASEPGRGSTFSIRMPLDRVVSDGITEAIIVLAGQEMFAIPSRQVTEVIAHDPAKVYTMQGERVVESRGSYYPLLDLAEVMECPGERGGQAPILIIALVGRREVALLGDELIGHQQVVLRSLEKRAFPTVNAVSGCALMGDQIGLMLDLDGLAAFIKPAAAAPTADAA